MLNEETLAVLGLRSLSSIQASLIVDLCDMQKLRDAEKGTTAGRHLSIAITELEGVILRTTAANNANTFDMNANKPS